MLEPEKYDDELRAHLAAFKDLLVDVDLKAAVPTCAGWTVHDLVDHLGYHLQWARAALREGEPARPPELEHLSAPTDAGEAAAWFAGRSADLLTSLDEVGTYQPCWGFGDRPRTSGFWWRRMTHETAIHLHDLRAACRTREDYSAGEQPVWSSAEMAADAVDEVVRLFFPRQVRLERCDPLLAAVLLIPEDIDGTSWVLAGDGRDPDAIPDVTVSGTAEQLALLVWRRLGADDERLTVQGDRGAVQHVMASEITP